MTRILVVDDDPAVLDGVCHALEWLGYEVICAHDGAEALTMAERFPPALILSDYRMPKLSGLDLAVALKKKPALRQVPILLMSGEKPTLTANVAAFLAKPVALDELEQAVTRTLVSKHAHKDRTSPKRASTSYKS